MMTDLAFKYISTAIAILPLSCVGLAVGWIFTTAIQSIAQNPSCKDKVQTFVYIGFAAAEAVALFAIIIACIIFFS